MGERDDAGPGGPALVDDALEGLGLGTMMANRRELVGASAGGTAMTSHASRERRGKGSLSNLAIVAASSLMVSLMLTSAGRPQ